MTKDLVVYYSLEGNTEYVASVLKEKIGADLLKLVPKKAYHDKGLAKFFWGGKSAVMAEKLKGKRFAAFACQSGAGAEKAITKLAKCIGISDFDKTAVFIDPKAKPDVKKNEQIKAFCQALTEDI